MPSPSKLPLPFTRERLNAELHPPVPKFGQFFEVCRCVGQVALQYYALARAYSILCGPAPVGGSLTQKGRHNALVRDLMRHFHGRMDDAVFVPFESRQRLLAGKQVSNSNMPVWDDSQGEKTSPLSLVFMREHCSFKADFTSILYDSSETSWFHATFPSSTCVAAETKEVFVALRKKVLAYAELQDIVVVPPTTGQWWVTFARDAVDAGSPASSSPPSASRKSAAPPLVFSSEAFSLAGSFAAAVQDPTSASVAVPDAVPSSPSVLVERRKDRPSYLACQKSDELAPDALKKGKVSKARARYDCNALGLREGGQFPKYVDNERWQAVVDNRIETLGVESKRRRVLSKFIFNALGETKKGKSYFMFCSNFVFQRSVFPHDEVTPLAVAPFSASPDAVVLDKIRADVALLRSKLGKKLKDLSDDAEVLLSDYRKLAEQANKRAKDAGEDFGIKVTSSGTIWRVGETR